MAQLRFDHYCAVVSNEAQRRMNHVTYGLRGARGAYAVAGKLNRPQFASYVASRDIETEFPGVIGFGFIERVQREDLAAFTEGARADGMPDFQVRTEGAHDDLFVIKYIYPLAPNRPAQGFDVGSELERREAIERAIRTGRSSLTGKIQLLQSDHKEPGFLYFLPIFRSDLSGRSARPTTNLVGVVYAPIRAEALFDGIMDFGNGLVDVHVYDGNVVNETKLILDADGQGFSSKRQAGDANYGGRLFSNERHIELGGRSWTLVMTSTDGISALIDRSSPEFVRWLGILVSLALAGGLWSLGTSRDRAVALATQMTDDLRTKSLEAEEAHKATESLWNTIQQHCIVSLTDEKGKILQANDAFCHISGYTEEELIGRSHAVVNSGTHSRAFWTQIWRGLANGESWRGEICNRNKAGELYWVDSIISPIIARDGSKNFLSIRFDITQKKESERKLLEQYQKIEDQVLELDAAQDSLIDQSNQLAQLNHELSLIATKDALTGLANRRDFTDRVSFAAVDYRELGTGFATLFIDLDNFKFVNDTMGHDAGDALLIEAARRISECTRSSDVVARLGGDEFALLLTDEKSVRDAHILAQRLVEALEVPHNLAGSLVSATGSVGLSRTPEGDPVEALTADVLIRNADTAMYVAKKAGKSMWREFEEWMHDESRHRAELERDLRAAVAEGQFSLEYQPVVSLHSGLPMEAEALLRWRHPVRGLVAPETFLPVLEETRLIERVGLWTLESACREFASHAECDDPIDLCVNVSAMELKRAHFVDEVQRILAETGLEPSRLTLEVKESSLSAEFNVLNPILAQLRALGIKIAIDDFGSGYASLSSLGQFEADKVKIDLPLVNMLGESFEATAIARALIVLCTTMGLRVIAEGVENDDQLIQLQTLGCDLGQGFLFAPSMPASDLCEWVMRKQQEAA